MGVKEISFSIVATFSLVALARADDSPEELEQKAFLKIVSDQYNGQGYNCVPPAEGPPPESLTDNSMIFFNKDKVGVVWDRKQCDPDGKGLEKVIKISGSGTPLAIDPGLLQKIDPNNLPSPVFPPDAPPTPQIGDGACQLHSDSHPISEASSARLWCIKN